MSRTASIFLTPSIFIAAFVLLILSLLLPAPANAVEFGDGGYLRTTYRVDGYYESVYGNRLNSTLDVDPETGDAFHYTEDLRIGLSRAIAPDVTVDLSLWGRHTDDRLQQRVPGEPWMINEFRLNLHSPAVDLGVGDLSAYFSNYTFNNTLFGATVVFRPSRAVTLSVLGGANRDAEKDTYKRVFGGIRIEARPAPWLVLSTCYVHAEITDLYPGTTVTDYVNDVWSLFARLSLMDERLALSGEFAESLYTADRRVPGNRPVLGSAGWCALSFAPIRNELSILLAYERVDPAFAGVMGTYSPDRETMSAGVRYTPSEMLSATAFFRRYHDRLSEASTALYRTDTMDPGLTLTYRPFRYDPDSPFKNLALDFRASFLRESSNDALHTVADERLLAHLGVSDVRGPIHWAVMYDLERYDDRTAANLDTLANTVAARIAYLYQDKRCTLSGDLLCEMKFEGIDDGVSDRRYLDRTFRVVAGLSAVIGPNEKYPTRGWVSYEGIFYRRESAADRRENAVEARLEQVFMNAGGLVGTLGVHGRLRDAASIAPGDSYGEEVLGVYLKLEF